MKDLLIGAVVGLVAGYAIRKLEDDGHFRFMCDYMNDAHEKATRKAKEAANTALNKVEYAADAVHLMAEEGKNKIK